MKARIYNSSRTESKTIFISIDREFKCGDRVNMNGKNMTCFGNNYDGEVIFVANSLEKKKSTYTGKEILDLILEKKFKEGDKIIATQEDNLGDKYITSYTYKHIINNDFEFQDDEFKDCGLDVFDLVCCIFEIVDMDEQNDKIKKLKELQEKRRKVKDEFVDLTNQIDKLTGAIK